MAIDSNELLGQALGTCTLERLIGRGGMGAVYLAQQSRPRRSVAVKVLVPGLLLESHISHEFLVRFRREADAIAALDHINIVPIYEYGEQEQLAYLVMPHVTGGTLRDVLDKRGILPLNEALPIIEQAAAALDYAHKQGIVHRDLKPGNILFHADGRVLLADFGLAKVLKDTTDTGSVPVVNSTLTSLGSVIGTPEYLSPEQATGNPIDQRTDIYSLGVILYQMLGGRVPFTGATPVAIAIKHTMEEPPPITQMNPALPHGVVAVIMRALAKKPEQRYATAGELVRALRAAMPQQYLDEQKSHLSTSKLILGSEDTDMASMSLLSNDTVLDLSALPDPEVETTLKTPYTPTPTAATQKVLAKANPAPYARGEERHGCQPLWMTLLGGLLAVVIVIGGLAAYLHSSQGSSDSTSSSGRIHAPVAGKATPTAVSQAVLPDPLVPVGKLLYGTNLPGLNCDHAGGKWSNGPNVQVTCGSSATEVRNTSTRFLAGAFLNTLSGNSAIPANYVLQVQVSEGPGSQGKYGVFFRNQPGFADQGTFSFLLDPVGHWYAYVYNDKTGIGSLLYEGQSTVQIDGLTTIDIIVSGSQFTFYLNGKWQGTAQSGLYPTGTIGLAAHVGADVFYKNLAIYALPG